MYADCAPNYHFHDRQVLDHDLNAAIAEATKSVRAEVGPHATIVSHTCAVLPDRAGLFLTILYAY